MFEEALSYDDVLLVPAYSDVLPKECDISTTLCGSIGLNVPIISAAMDTVTEEKLAIALALEGGAGGALLAEPAYILLAESGVSDAHEVIRKITLAMEEKNIDFPQALAGEKETLSRIAAKMAELGLISPNATTRSEEAALEWFGKPERYRGLAVKKARDITAKYKREELYV